MKTSYMKISGFALRTNFDNLPEQDKTEIRDLCTKYGVKTKCTINSDSQTMQFRVVGLDNAAVVEFQHELERILDTKSTGARRLAGGHPAACPL